MMELQRRQRTETANRFQKHLDGVQEILQRALRELPEPMEVDSKLMTEMEVLVKKDGGVKEEGREDPCCILDRIMCKVVDSMQ